MKAIMSEDEQGFKITDVACVIETSDEHKVNRYLKEGWTLINTYKTWDGPRDQHEDLIYALGWAKPGEPVCPEPKYP
jgi:hypothetical protein